MLLALRLAIAFALLAPAALAGTLDRWWVALGVAAVAYGVGLGASRYVLRQREKGRSTPASELVMIIAAIVVGLVGSWQVAAALPGP